MSKILKGLKDAITVARCSNHEFKFVRNHKEGGVVGRCPRCEGDFYAWPGTIYYHEIVAAKKGRER